MFLLGKYTPFWKNKKYTPAKMTPDIKIYEVGSHTLLRGIFPTQGVTPGLSHCRQVLYHLSHQGSPLKPTERYSFPFFKKWSSWGGTLRKLSHVAVPCFIFFLALQHGEIQKCTKRRQRDKDDPREEGASRNEKVRRVGRASRPALGADLPSSEGPPPAPTVRFPGQEGARRGAEREPPLLRQAPVHRGPRAQVQELLPRGGPGSLQRVSDSWPRVRQTARVGGVVLSGRRIVSS